MRDPVLPQLAFIALAGLGVYAFVRREWRTRVGSLLRRGRAAGDARAAAELAAQVRVRDPVFDGDVFEARVRKAFGKMLDARRSRDLAQLRPFVSDGVYERLAMEVAERRDLGVSEAADAVVISSTRLAAVAFEGRFDAATVQINTIVGEPWSVASELERGSVERRESVFWTFLRRRGAKTKPSADGLMEGSCPNCGTPILGNQFADCPVCKSHVRSGEYDWVLVGIDADGEWQPSKYRRLLALSQSAVDDFEFCVEALEDRATVAFWRRLTAMRVGDARILAGVATPNVVDELESSRAAGDSKYRFFGECAVAGVEMLGVARDGAFNRALVEFTWSATKFVAGADRAPRRLGRTGLQTSLFVFERAVGVRTRIDEGFSSAHCRGCGAPAEGTSAVCAHCGGTLADVNAGWALSLVTTREAFDGRALLEQAHRTAGLRSLDEPPSPNAAGLVAWACVVAANGNVDARERDAVTRLARRAGIARARTEQILADAEASGARTLQVPPSREAASEWLDAAARIAVVDGFVSAGELALLVRLGEAAGVSDSKVRALIARVRAEAIREARAELARRDGG